MIGRFDGSHDHINMTPHEKFVAKKWFWEYKMTFDQTMEYIKLEREKFNAIAHRHMNKVNERYGN